MLYSLEGMWRAALPGFEGALHLPGTLDEGGIGGPDTGEDTWHPDPELGSGALASAGGPIATRLTRRHTYEGEARFVRRVDFNPKSGERVFLEVERARCLRLLVDGAEAPRRTAQTLSAPQVFEVTGLIRPGAELTLVSDNSYPGLPRNDIVYASAATDETQTNWNGALGYVRLRTEEPVFIEALRVYPHGDRIDVQIDLSAARPYRGKVRLTSPALAEEAGISVDVPAGEHALRADALPLAADVRRWDEYEGELYELTATPEGCEARTVRFGARDFGDDGAGHLALNGRRIFLRGEANCAVFPETGHPPMTAAEWTDILQIYRSYGVNVMRFHSWCPPEAAFAAADALGMLMQPELSHWNPKDAFESDESYGYYRTELRRILLAYANHPSFVMLTLGNELAAGETGHERMDALLDMARSLDDTRLYANGSNVHYGERGCDPASDFYTSSGYYSDALRATLAGSKQTGGALPGHLNTEYPSARHDYSATMARLRAAYKKPVFGFEVGQYEVLPDFDELSDFRGVTDPANLRLVRDRVIAKGLEPVWRDWVEATGELALLCYREEVEAALRTPEMSGLSLLGLQDFPGQGTALVGMLNSHLQPKPHDFARPERFAAFFRSRLPLALLERYTWESGETLSAPIVVANYGKGAIPGPLRWRLKGEGVALGGELPARAFPEGGLTPAGRIDIPLSFVARPTRLELALEAGETVNRYPLWVYPRVEPRCPEGVVAADSLAGAKAALEAGRRVFLDPPMSAPLRSVPSRFSTDFWSVGTFPWQSGTMGQRIDADHPIFRRFPTETHTNWQWWPMATRRAVEVPRTLEPIVAQPDSYATLRSLAQLFECRVGSGRLLFSSVGLREIQQYPEARALLDAIYSYMDSDEFDPSQALTMDGLEDIFKIGR